MSSPNSYQHSEPDPRTNVWQAFGNSPSMDDAPVAMQPMNSYPHPSHSGRIPLLSFELPNPSSLLPSRRLHYGFFVMSDGRGHWQRSPVCAADMQPTGATHQSRNSNVSSCLDTCNGPFSSSPAMDELKSIEFKILVLGIRRRFEEMTCLLNPTAEQLRGDISSAERHVASLFEEILDLQNQLRTRLVKDRREWNCPHLLGQCPILGYGVLPPHLNAQTPCSAPDGLNQPPRAYSAPPFTYLAPLQHQCNEFVLSQSLGALPRGDFCAPLRPSFEFVNSSSFVEVPLFQQPQNAQSVAPVVFTDPANGVDSRSCPPPPPPLPQQPATPHRDDHSSEDGVVQDLQPCKLRGPPYLAESVQFHYTYEVAGSDPAVVFNRTQDYIRFIEINPQQQVGPTCGLLALSLIGNLQRQMTVEWDVLPLARDLGFTHQGEMFNADEMACLARELLGSFCEVRVMTGNPLQEQSDAVFDMLQHNTVLLVPYDNDVNNSPGLYDGTKAHWCVVVGSAQYRGQRFFCAAQGKSETLAFWREDVLARSNNQLFHAHPGHPVQSFFKIGDLRRELCGQIVTLTFQPGSILRLAYCSNPNTMVEYFEYITK